MPRFSQVFFHSFDRREVENGLGQSRTGGVVSRRAAEAYVQSGARLESLCGISDVWYHYVELNAKRFTQPNFASARFSPRPSIHPGPTQEQMETMGNLFNWGRLHSRPRPTRTGRVLQTSTVEVRDDGREGMGGETSSKAAVRRGKDGCVEETVSEGLTDNKSELTVCLKCKADRSISKESHNRVGVSVGGEKEDGNSSEFAFEEWPVTSSFNKAMDCAVELLMKAPAKGEGTEGTKAGKQVDVEGSGDSRAREEKAEKRRREEEAIEGKEGE
jgi:hypothetical protein